MIHLAQFIQAVKDKDNMALHCTRLLPSCPHQLCMHLTPQQVSYYMHIHVRMYMC